MSKRAVGRPWTASEDQFLANAVAIHGEADNWKAVALAVPGRTNKACRKRWLHSLSPNVKKTAWSREEDNLLLELYEIHSAKWALIARNIPGRTDDACSKRYREALDPSLKKDDWTSDEDEQLIAAYNRLGGKWGRVGQELQRSGLGCRNRWRLLQRKRASASLAPPSLPGPPSPPVFSMIEPSHYWHDPSSHAPSPSTVDVLADTPPPVQHAQLVPHLVDYTTPFHYSSCLSSALSSQHAIRYEKDADTASNRRQSLVLPTASVPPDNASAAVFVPFDYDSISPSCALSVSSTSPAPQSTYAEDMHQPNIYNDRPHQFHQLQRSLPHTAIPLHVSSARPVQVDHYTASVPHEEPSLSQAALSSRHHPAAQSTSLRAPSSADSYFATSVTSHLPEQHANHVSSSMTSVSLLDKSDTYYHPSPEPQLDVNAHHSLLPSPDPLPLSESRPSYHYAHQRDPSRARVVETMHGQEQHGEYHHSHVSPEQSHHGHQSSRPQTTSPSDVRYALHPPARRNVNTPTQPEAGPSRITPDHHYYSNPLNASQLVRRSTASPRAVGMPYPKRRSSDSMPTNIEDREPLSFRPIPRQKIGVSSGNRPDTQTQLRLSSDLQATPDPSIKPYACGHESCWPSNATLSRASYCTSRGLSDHNKTVHPDDSGGDRPYRCGLEGCGKSWKSVNGLQYHLQISKAHFQHAITSSFVSSYISGLAVPASVEASTSSQGEDKAKKQYKCPHENCPNRYKQLSGLRYHLAHGHPVELPKQLDLVPPALSRKLAEKMRTQASVSSPSEHQAHDNSLEASHRSTGGSLDS